MRTFRRFWDRECDNGMISPRLHNLLYETIRIKTNTNKLCRQYIEFTPVRGRFLIFTKMLIYQQNKNAYMYILGIGKRTNENKFSNVRQINFVKTPQF